jgi:hypothetical protein
MPPRPNCYPCPSRMRRRRSFHGVERLELRQYLSASPLPAPPAAMPVAAWVAPAHIEGPVHQADGADVRRLDARAATFEGLAERYALQPVIPTPLPVQTKFGGGPGAEITRIRTEELPQEEGTLAPSVIVLTRLTITPAKGAAELASLEPAPAEEPVAPLGPVARFNALNLIISPTVSPAPFLPPPQWQSDWRGAGSSLARFMPVFLEGWQPMEVSQMSGQDSVPLDGHARYFVVVHESFAESRMAPMLPDSVHLRSIDAFALNKPASGERHLANSLTAPFGPSADADAVFSIRGRAIGAALQNNLVALGEETEATDTANERAAVGYLVAFNNTIVGSLLGAASAAIPSSESGESAAVGSLIQDLLTPRLAFNAEALSFAINEFAAQADELGVGLLSMLSDPVATGEAAIVTGLIGAGLAYRHWRGMEQREQGEEQELLSARFIRGPASLRLSRRISP